MNYQLIDLPLRTDARGTLGFAQQGDHVPFGIRRIFYILDVPAGASRGGHAHLRQHQFMMMLTGACKVQIDDAKERHSIRLANRSAALYVPPMLWLEMSEFEPQSVCAVLASDVYDERDYIRNYSDFVQLATS